MDIWLVYLVIGIIVYLVIGFILGIYYLKQTTSSNKEKGFYYMFFLWIIVIPIGVTVVFFEYSYELALKWAGKE